MDSGRSLDSSDIRFALSSYLDFGARFGQVTDGTSNTLCMMEMLQAPSDGVSESAKNDRRGRLWNDDTATYQISTRLAPNSSSNDFGTCFNQPQLKLHVRTAAGE